MKQSTTKLYIILLLLFSIESSIAQKLNHTFYTDNCKINIAIKSNDTIIAYANPNCSLLKVDTTQNGTWLIYSVKDSISLIYSVKIVTNKKEGLEYVCNKEENTKTYINYQNGKKEGAFLQTTFENNVKYFCSYMNDIVSGDSYSYEYSDKTGALFRLRRYDKNGKLKEEKLFDSGVYRKFYTPEKKK